MADAGGMYGAARATLRETVKWLVAAFASIAAVIVAGSPLATSAEVDTEQKEFWFAVAFAFVALGCAAFALRIALDVLRPDGIYASRLCRPLPGEAAEITAARNEINDNHVDLLPHPYERAEQLLDWRSHILSSLDQLPNGASNKQLDDDLALAERHLGRVLDFASYWVLHRRLAKARPRLFVLGLATLATLTVSVTLGKAIRAEATSGVTVLVLDGHATPAPSGSPSAPSKDDAHPQLDPVRFSPLSAELTAEGMEAIRKARDVLERDVSSSILLAAHTDTMAGDTVNIGLARRRGEAVRATLLKQGGIAARRVLVSELPESTLPRITGEQVRDAANRSVELHLLRVPQPLQAPVVR